MCRVNFCIDKYVTHFTYVMTKTNKYIEKRNLWNRINIQSFWKNDFDRTNYNEKNTHTFIPIVNAQVRLHCSYKFMFC